MLACSCLFNLRKITERQKLPVRKNEPKLYRMKPLFSGQEPEGMFVPEVQSAGCFKIFFISLKLLKYIPQRFLNKGLILLQLNTLLIKDLYGAGRAQARLWEALLQPPEIQGPSHHPWREPGRPRTSRGTME